MQERLWTHEDLKVLLERGTIADLERLLADPGRQFRAEFANSYVASALEKIANAEVLPDDIQSLLQRILTLHKTATDPLLGHGPLSNERSGGRSMRNQEYGPQCMSFAGLPQRNLRTIEVSSLSLKSRFTAYPLMGFAGLQVWFPSKRPKTTKNSTQWNKLANMWITCGKVSLRTKGECHAQA